MDIDYKVIFYYSFMMNNDYTKTYKDLIRYKDNFNKYHKEIMTVWLETKTGKNTN